jgi:hypothetical protein
VEQAGRFRRSVWYEELFAISRNREATRATESSSPDYEQRFRAPEQAFSRRDEATPTPGSRPCAVATGSFYACAGEGCAGLWMHKPLHVVLQPSMGYCSYTTCLTTSFCPLDHRTTASGICYALLIIWKERMTSGTGEECAPVLVQRRWSG